MRDQKNAGSDDVSKCYSRRRYLTTAVSACTVGIAGCTDMPFTDDSSDGTTDTQAGATISGEGEISVEGSDLSINPNKIFQRVNELLQMDVDPPDRIIVEDESVINTEHALDTGIVSELITEEVTSVPGVSGLHANGDIRIATAGRTPANIEATLVHEYVHHVQSFLEFDKIDSGASSFVQNCLFEGGAEFVTDTYIKQYLDWEQLKADQIDFLTSNYNRQFSFGEVEITSYIDLIEAVYYQVNAAEQVLASPYVIGSQYLAGQLDSVSEYPDIYNVPPQTTKQLLHGYPPEREQPGNLMVDLSGPPSSFRRLGELRLRLFLSSETDYQTAVEAAKGWDNDKTVEVFHQGRIQGYVCTIRMENKSEKSELLEAMDAYLGSRAENRGGHWFDEDEATSLTVETVDERTLVLGVGSEAFTQSLTASTDGEVVRLEVSL